MLRIQVPPKGRIGNRVQIPGGPATVTGNVPIISTAHLRGKGSEEMPEARRPACVQRY